jgi:hypothetical protein
MGNLSRQELESMLSVETELNGLDATAELELAVPAFQRTFKVTKLADWDVGDRELSKYDESEDVSPPAQRR